MIAVKAKGNYSKAKGSLKLLRTGVRNMKLAKYGKWGVEALAEATPKDSGRTADSWYYKIEQTNDSAKIIWSNSNRNKGEMIAILLQYGHGTGTGGYVQGIDYINPAMKPVFEKIAKAAWEEVKRL